MSRSLRTIKPRSANAAEAERAPHAAERQQAILTLLRKHRFVTFRNLEREVGGSPATLRRDLERLASEGQVSRVHGAVRLVENTTSAATGPSGNLKGVPFQENIARHALEKQAIGRAAAALCRPGDAVIIDGGSTTLQMCAHLTGMHLQVFTNSLHIVGALLPLPDIRVQVPGGTVFKEQNIILGGSDDPPPKFKAPQLFMGAAAVAAQGVMQADLVLVAAERRLIDRADELILLVDSSKFEALSGHIVCALEELDVVVTDGGLGKSARKQLEAAGVRVVIA
jgi:DeoR family ulaG and ulaABCDEF operon transcriptional repressor